MLLFLVDKDPYLELCNSGFASGAWTRNFYDISGINPNKVVDIFSLANINIRTRTRKLDLGSRLVLQLIEVLTTTTNQSAMLSIRDSHSQDYTVA